MRPRLTRQALPFDAEVREAGARRSTVAPLSIAPCSNDEFCLLGDRFRVDVTWRDFEDATGTAVPNRLSDHSAWFWFFEAGNPEMLVKIVDGSSVNDRIWVFYGALSNVGFDLRITDRISGKSVVYTNPVGSFAADGDVDALPAATL